MTCIVGVVDKENNRVVIGGDSAGAAGCDITIRTDVKVFKNGNFIIGSTSSFRMIQLLQFSFKPVYNGDDEHIYQYMCTTFIEEVRDCFRTGGYLQKDTKGDELGGQFLVAYKDRLFTIDNDFNVGESLNGIASIGCGAPYALGVLFALFGNGVFIEDKVERALQAAEFFSTCVRQPFIIINT